jgi:hypothetical protein
MHLILRKLLRSCQKSTALIDKKLFSPLTITEKVQLNAHKMICKTCNSYEKQSQFIDTLIGHLFAASVSNGSIKMTEAKKLSIIESIKKA